MPFNPLKDLEPVVQLSAFPLVLEVHPSLGVKTVAELLALAKSGKTLSFASAGNGTPQHLAGELFNSMEQVKLGHVPYRGAGPALNDLIGGAIDKLNATVNAIFKDPAFRTRWEAIGTPAVGGTAAEFGALIKSDAQRLGALVRSTGVTLD
jgi:tripartite-type tricarboxylate transporter receptor subunit TctC